jgi:putative transposase
MKKRRFSVEQIVGVLKQAEVGVPVAEVIHKAGLIWISCTNSASI